MDKHKMDQHHYGMEHSKVHDHLDNMLKTKTWGMADAAHMGGAASMLQFLERKMHGEATFVKKELKRAVDYFFYYETTKNPMYHTLAEDAFMHVKQLCEAIKDPKEQKEVYAFLEDVEHCLMSKSEELKGGGYGG